MLGSLAVLAVAGALLPAASAMASNGELYAFGLNDYGELGSATNNGTFNPNPTPTPVTLPGAKGSVAEVATGIWHSLAVTSTGQLYAFGRNYIGELGSTTNLGTVNPNPTPTLVTLPGATGPVTQAAAGTEHSLAVTATGQLYAFGSNFFGQLGTATNVETGNPNATPTLVALPGAPAVTQVAAGPNDSLAVTSTGQLYAFGMNEYGQLGSATNNGTITANPTPTLVALPGATGPVTQVAADTWDSLAVTSTGQLYAFGDNEDGQLGSTINNGTNTANPTPMLVTLPGATGPVTQVAAASEASLALTSTGQLYAFGLNVYGELGNATNNGNLNPNPTPTLVTLPGATGAITQVAGGADDSFAVTSTGQLYAFGWNYYGQLGSATNVGTFNANPTPTLVTLPGAARAVGLGSGADDTLAIVEGPPEEQPPEFGRCVRDGKGGAYTTANCLVKSPTHTGRYEWEPGVVKTPFTTQGKSKALLETATGQKVTCVGEKGSGEYTGTKTVGNVLMRLTGCLLVSTKAACSSAGAAPGEIKTESLEGTLGYIALGGSPAEDTAGIDLRPSTPSTGPVAQLSCAATKAVVYGSVIEHVVTNKMLTVAGVRFIASKGKQQPESLLGAPIDVLEEILSGGKPEKAGLSLIGIQTNQEEVEVNTVV